VTVRLSPAEARRLGIDTPTTRTTRRVARAPYHSRCTACGDEFTTEAAEERHLAAGGHHRYESVLA